MWNDRGCFTGSLSSPTSLSDSHGILEHWQRWPLWSGLVFPAHLLWDLLVFQSITGHLEGGTAICSSTAVNSQTSEVNASGWLGRFCFCLFGVFKPALFHFPGALRSGHVIGKFSDPLRNKMRNCFKLFLCLCMSHLQNPVNPDGAVARLKSLYESEIWKTERERKKNRQKIVVLSSFTNQWAMSGHGSADVTKKAQGNNRIIVFRAWNFTLFTKLLYLISVFLYSLKLWQILSDMQSRQNRPYLSPYV